MTACSLERSVYTSLRDLCVCARYRVHGVPECVKSSEAKEVL